MLSCGVATEDGLPGKCFLKVCIILFGRMDLADDELKKNMHLSCNIRQS